jgi:uncharacterized protein
MTPQERELVSGLFDRLAALENSPRDPDAERAIIEGLRRAPNAAYALVQTALVQDEALKRADARIQELEAARDGDSGGAAQPAGFLDGMREALLGRREGARGGSVPSVRPGAPAGAAAAPAYAAPQPAYAAPQMPYGGGGSFLGTAASAAAGVIGGALLLDGIRSMMGHGHGAYIADPAFGASPEHSSPWDSGSGSPGDLTHQAGIDDVGTADHGHGDAQSYSDDGRGDQQGFFDNGGSDQDASYDQADRDGGDFDTGGDFGGDFGGGDFGGSDVA